MTLTEYCLLPKSTSSTSPKLPLPAENSKISGEDSDKNTAHNALKHAISSEKKIFFGEGA